MTTPKTWLTEIGKIAPAPPATPTAPASCDVGDMESCTTTWCYDLGRHFIRTVPSRLFLFPAFGKPPLSRASACYHSPIFSPDCCASGGIVAIGAVRDEVMSRSYVEVTANDPKKAEQAQQITDHVNWDRYLSLIQGRTAYAPIKFNGQAFNCNNTGKGWDARDWGAGYWW